MIRDLCKDFSVTLTPLQDVEKFETADFERHFKKVRKIILTLKSNKNYDLIHRF